MTVVHLDWLVPIREPLVKNGLEEGAAGAVGEKSP
jgi:hypothetical protein